MDCSFPCNIAKYRKRIVVKNVPQLVDSLSEVLTAIIHLIPLVVTSSFHARLLYTYAIWKMLFPCPKAIPGTEKVLKNFSLSVWITIDLVLLLTTAVFWCAGNGPYRSVYNETHTYQSLYYSFQNAWAVFVGVSVPQQTKNFGLRISSFCTSVSVSLLELYSKHSLFLIWWNRSMKKDRNFRRTAAFRRSSWLQSSSPPYYGHCNIS